MMLVRRRQLRSFGFVSFSILTNLLPFWPQFAWTAPLPWPHSASSAPMFAIRTEIDCRKIPRDRLMVALAFGQSNSANYGNRRLTAQKTVYNFHAGKCYRAVDPLLGADGNGGSVWTRLGNKLVQRKLYDRVLFTSIGVGGTEIQRWAPGGDLHPRITAAMQQLEVAGFTITHLLWHQGETDAEIATPKVVYQQRFMAMLERIRAAGVQAPIYVSITSRCGDRLPQPSIQAAQRELVNPAQGILLGPNTDELGNGDRYDRCHFSASGLDKVADLWVQALMHQPK